MKVASVLIEDTGLIIELAGVLVILLGLLYGIVKTVQARRRGQDDYRTFRLVFGRALFLGMEILVAADIVKTVGLSPTLNDVAVLGLLVLVRTFLGWALMVELEGRWPWQRARPEPVDLGVLAPEETSAKPLMRTD
jgi:uncharacterized membrane protein